MRSWLLGRSLLIVVLGAALLEGGGPLAAQTGAPRLRSGTLVQPRTTFAANGHAVISMEAKGDLRGMITFELDPNGDGTYAGKWALVVAYAEEVNPGGSIGRVAADAPRHDETPDHEHAAHHEYLRFVRQGTIFGAVASATLDASGIATAQLVVADGSLEFLSAKGAGAVTRTPQDPPVTSLSLSF